MTKTMTLIHFTHALDRHGPDLSCWPAPSAAAGRELLRHSAVAREALSAAEATATVLRAPMPDVSDLKARILAAARASGQALRDNIVPFPTRRVLAPAVFALAASLLVGIFAGWTGMVGDPLTTTYGDDAQSYEIQALTAGDNHDS
ncbi:hypothetical protein [Zavarzinia sp.]|uniref:hypothetical protein n=1 Tax=Zavarzinia sp. TaxID=2027920 RepID=UPI003BB80106|nr:hypothetical protein [Zavarzinia sp.]